METSNFPQVTSSPATPYRIPTPRPSPPRSRLDVTRLPVAFSIADFGNDQRVAFATISLGAGEVTYWDPLTCEGPGASLLQPSDTYGYPVDAGTGSFMDAITQRALLASSNESDDLSTRVITELERTIPKHLVVGSDITRAGKYGVL